MNLPTNWNILKESIICTLLFFVLYTRTKNFNQIYHTFTQTFCDVVYVLRHPCVARHLQNSILLGLCCQFTVNKLKSRLIKNSLSIFFTKKKHVFQHAHSTQVIETITFRTILSWTREVLFLAGVTKVITLKATKCFFLQSITCLFFNTKTNIISTLHTVSIDYEFEIMTSKYFERQRSKYNLFVVQKLVQVMTGVYTMYYADDGTFPTESEEKAKEMLLQRREVEMHNYYEYIKPFTYPTEFVYITMDEAEALRQYFRQGKVDEQDESTLHFKKLKEKITDALKQLEAKDEKQVDNKEQNEKENENKYSKKENINHGKYFIRLSTRSPKDAVDKPPFIPKLMELLTDRFCNDEKDWEIYQDLNQRLIGLHECFSKVMCVSTLEEILDLLSYSNRCVSDIRRLVTHKHLLTEENGGWQLYLVIRKFEFIPIQNEFRCFVYNRKITAVTQYFPHCLFEQIAKNKLEILDLIQQFFQTELFRDKQYILPVDDCILDLNVDLTTKQVKIIELNPFALTTGSGFYHWVDDKSILYGEKSDITKSDQIRVRETIDNKLSAVLSQWSDILKQFEQLHDNKKTVDNNTLSTDNNQQKQSTCNFTKFQFCFPHKKKESELVINAKENDKSAYNQTHIDDDINIKLKLDSAEIVLSSEDEIKELTSIQLFDQKFQGKKNWKGDMERLFVIRQIEKKGRGLIALQNMAKGTLLFSERPMFSCLNEENLGKFCSYCYNPIIDPIPTRDLSAIKYDDFCVNCGDLGGEELQLQLAGLRNRDCVYIHFFQFDKLQKKNVKKKVDSKFGKFPIMARAAMVHTLKALLSRKESLWSGILGRLCYVNHTNHRKEPYDMWIEYVLQRRQQYSLIQNLDRDTLMKIIPFEMYQRILNILHLNCITIQFRSNATNTTQDVGTGLFGLASFFNHSCVPNVMLEECMEQDSGLGNFVTCEDVSKGDELCLQYAGKGDDYITRQNYFHWYYGFKCECAKCLEDAKHILLNTKNIVS
ncbi:hypothetical protein RFI_25418 [Reticulomyxa filosa]|uniref:SET domain-containing protein n=1 Tax=Reticulomyxa filosa TaxID=46433 RepID=X6MD71_RETFI|nr:hypothetical protein RFI_25418 [Reticulomyxa filosa]|eukprot:ETO11958.1 hypothetical protein RFI_25418 [Reticulomyxa filosa]